MEFEPGVWPPAKTKTSSFRGVHWCSSKRLWRAEIEVSGISHKLGRYTEEHAAARAYDSAAIRLGVPERCNAWWAYTTPIKHHRTRRAGRTTMRIARA